MNRWTIGFVALAVTFVFSCVTVRFFAFDATTEAPVDAPPEQLNVEIASVSALDQAVDPERDIEFFADAERIGRKGRNRVEVKCFENSESKIVRILFYTRTNDGQWTEKQSIGLPRDNVGSCSPKIRDFNNDGFGDVTYISASAARGANELRTLLIYHPANDKLIHIKNSDEHPNLEYNETLNSLTAWAFHGATHTTFLRIRGDRLEAFATVATGDELVVDVVDKNGKWREIRREKMHQDDIFTRYSTFDPPTPDNDPPSSDDFAPWE